MTVPQKRLVIVGATGMVGGEALRYALDHPAVGDATAIGRKPTGLAHPKLKEVLHQGFADCSALAGALTDQRTSTLCSLAENPILAIACCARSIPHLGQPTDAAREAAAVAPDREETPRPRVIAAERAPGASRRA